MMEGLSAMVALRYASHSAFPKNKGLPIRLMQISFAARARQGTWYPFPPFFFLKKIQSFRADQACSMTFPFQALYPLRCSALDLQGPESWLLDD